MILGTKISQLMTFIYFTLVWFEGLSKDLDSRSNGEIQAKIPHLIVLNGTLLNPWLNLFFPSHRFANIMIFFFKSRIEATSHFIAEKS